MSVRIKSRDVPFGDRKEFEVFSKDASARERFRGVIVIPKAQGSQKHWYFSFAEKRILNGAEMTAICSFCDLIMGGTAAEEAARVAAGEKVVVKVLEATAEFAKEQSSEKALVHVPR